MLRLGTRKLLDRSFTGMGVLSIALLTAALLILLAPMCLRGVSAYVFQGTVEFRRVLLEQFQRGDRDELKLELTAATAARQPVFDALAAYQRELDALPATQRRKMNSEFEQVRTAVKELLGPLPGETLPLMMRSQYGQTRWDRAQVKVQKILFAESYDFSGGGLGRQHALGKLVFCQVSHLGIERGYAVHTDHGDHDQQDQGDRKARGQPDADF